MNILFVRHIWTIGIAKYFMMHVKTGLFSSVIADEILIYNVKMQATAETLDIIVRKNATGRAGYVSFRFL